MKYTFNTTDGHEFRKFKDSVVWQSVLDFTERFGDKHMVGLGQNVYTLENEEDVKIMSRYLFAYLNFKAGEIVKFYTDTFPIEIIVDSTDKVIEVSTN